MKKEKNISKILILMNEKSKLNDISKELDLSQPTIRGIIRYLKNNKILLGKRVVARFKEVGYEEIFLGINVMPEFLLSVSNALNSIKEIVELYRTSGDHVLLAHIIAPREKYNIILEKIRNIEGIDKIYPAFVEDIIKY